RFQNLNRSSNRSGNHSFSIVCSAVLDGTHSSVDRDGATIACDWRVTATPAAESTRGTMKSPIRQCGLLLMALTVCTEPALAARSYLNCQTKKAIIIDAPNGKSSLSTEENVGFWVDDAAKTITLEDGTPLIVRRFDDRWIGAARDDVSY